MLFARPLAELISQLERLPGVGPKSAQRLAFHIVRMPQDDVRRLSETLVHARESLKLCTVCQNVSEKDVCETCDDPRRDPLTICVVSEPKDVAAMERIHEFKGRYHVLHGLLNPMDGVGPEHLKVRELLERLRADVAEVIVATNPSVEGEATALYLQRVLQPMGFTVTRIASGLPIGGDFEYADPATISRAIAGRQRMA